MQLKDSIKIINQPISEYLEEVVKKFGYRPISFEMQPIIQYLLNTVLLSMCGAFEEKIETCKYFIAGIDSNSRYQFLKKVEKSEYKADDIVKIINQFRKSLSNDEYDKKYLKNKEKNKEKKEESLFKSVYDEKKNIVQYEVKQLLEKTEIEQHLKKEFVIFNDKWLNICSSEYDETLVLKGIYDRLFLNRHELAHNLKSLYTDNQDFESFQGPLYYLNNYFIKICLLMCFDLYIIDLFKESIR